jgi:hypothetical protein
MPQEPEHKMRTAAAMALTIIFMPVMLLGLVYCMCRAMFVAGITLTEELFED